MCAYFWTGKVIERYEEAFVCYGIPSANDPNGYGCHEIIALAFEIQGISCLFACSACLCVRRQGLIEYALHECRCRVKRSVGPVRVFSRAPGPAAQENAGIDGAAGADEAVVETDE